jgi:hypothetical protein
MVVSGMAGGLTKPGLCFRGGVVEEEEEEEEEEEKEEEEVVVWWWMRSCFLLPKLLHEQNKLSTDHRKASLQ